MAGPRLLSVTARPWRTIIFSATGSHLSLTCSRDESILGAFDGRFPFLPYGSTSQTLLRLKWKWSKVETLLPSNYVAFIVSDPHLCNVV